MCCIGWAQALQWRHSHGVPNHSQLKYMCSRTFDSQVHDDVIQWKHFSRYWPFLRRIHQSPVDCPHKGQWRGAMIVSLICALKNNWANNRDAGDLRHRRAHYDVTVISLPRVGCYHLEWQHRINVLLNGVQCKWHIGWRTDEMATWSGINGHK